LGRARIAEPIGAVFRTFSGVRRTFEGAVARRQARSPASLGPDYPRAVTPDPALSDEDYCYLTTIGRTSGRPREIEIWFGLDGEVLYMLSGGRDRSDWVKNLKAESRVSVRIADEVMHGQARIVADPEEDRKARTLLVDKYSSRYGGDLSSWKSDALPVAVDLRKNS
jgi:deazaflavin-dependent oxidoreductase (nitroreductase family)